MRKSPLKTVLYTVLGTVAAFILCTCILRPVDTEELIEDDRVQSIIRGGERINVDLEDLERGQPVLLHNGSLINKGAIVTLYLPGARTPQSADISVRNYSDFAAINWYSAHIETPIGSTQSITVNTEAAPFNMAGDHLLTVELFDAEGVLRTSFITIRVLLN